MIGQFAIFQAGDIMVAGGRAVFALGPLQCFAAVTGAAGEICRVEIPFAQHRIP